MQFRDGFCVIMKNEETILEEAIHIKLLIIEDEADLLRVLQKYFVKKGYIVDTAADGLEGYQLYEINAYDLIILDLNLPTMDGIEVLSRIRERTSPRGC